LCAMGGRYRRTPEGTAATVGLRKWPKEKERVQEQPL
jgi:hypothetical protein